MDEVTALRQQVAALQLQNTQLMVRFSAISVLLVCVLLPPWVWLYHRGEPLSAIVLAVADHTSPLTDVQQGLLRDQAPSPQPKMTAPPKETPSGGDAYTVGVMVLGASGTSNGLPRGEFSSAVQFSCILLESV